MVSKKYILFVLFTSLCYSLFGQQRLKLADTSAIIGKPNQWILTLDQDLDTPYEWQWPYDKGLLYFQTPERMPLSKKGIYKSPPFTFKERKLWDWKPWIDDLPFDISLPEFIPNFPAEYTAELELPEELLPDEETQTSIFDQFQWYTFWLVIGGILMALFLWWSYRYQRKTGRVKLAKMKRKKDWTYGELWPYYKELLAKHHKETIGTYTIEKALHFAQSEAIPPELNSPLTALLGKMQKVHYGGQDITVQYPEDLNLLQDIEEALTSIK